MSNSGKQLENIVKQIESYLLPRGFSIESRERIFNDEGIQIAEFDIQIKGRVGSAPFSMLLECRDRPSEGPSPGSWIEQLVGRRTRFKFDKVVAVSTTGFAEGAKEFAVQSGIELRLLTELEPELILSWFRAILKTKYAVPIDVKVFPVNYGNHNEEIRQQLSSVLKSSNIDTPLLITNMEHKWPEFSLRDVWKKVVDGDINAFEGLITNGPKKFSNYIVVLEDQFKDINIPSDKNTKKVRLLLAQSGAYIRSENFLIRIMAIVFSGKFWVTHEAKLPQKAFEYSIFHDKSIATTVHFDLGDEEAVFVISPNNDS